MELDPETVARFLAAICKQAIRDYQDGWHEPGYPAAAAFLQEAGLLRPDGAIGGRSPTMERPILPCGRLRNPTHERTAVMDDDLATIDGMRALPVPVPLMLERALASADHAHGASARLICFSWEPTGDDAPLH